MASSTDDSKAVKYGELLIIGYNGFLPPCNRGRKRSKYELYKRPVPNGVKRSKHCVVETPHSSEAILDSTHYSISYSLSKSQAVLVDYSADEETDMFQIGRSLESPVDFVVVGTVPRGITGIKAKRLLRAISRFACRIDVDRSNPRVARIYAAGFDCNRKIFLGEKATNWQKGPDLDGLTTNGVLLMHPTGSFCGGDCEPGLWREVSAFGDIYSLREFRASPHRGQKIHQITNILQDGSLVDLCGATLLWRSAVGLEKSPTTDYLESLVYKLNAGRPVCPKGLNTLDLPRKIPKTGSDVSTHDKQQPYVYLSCGHVQASHKKKSNTGMCPSCSKVGPVQRLCMGIEPAFYVDIVDPAVDVVEPPNFFAFNPCGHMATEITVKYWAKVPFPYGTNDFHCLCPFCVTPLQGSPGYVRLIF